MGRRAKRKRERKSERRRFARAVQHVRELFSSGPPTIPDDWSEPDEGVGVREPRQPLRPSLGGAVALEIPPGETRDVWAVGEDDSR